jgi:serine/threonine protein kinase
MADPHLETTRAGVARAIDSEAHVTRQTDLGQFVGTLAYVSPEQVLADPLELDTRSDVQALGVILFNCWLAGSRARSARGCLNLAEPGLLPYLRAFRFAAPRRAGLFRAARRAVRDIYCQHRCGAH